MIIDDLTRPVLLNHIVDSPGVPRRRRLQSGSSRPTVGIEFGGWMDVSVVVVAVVVTALLFDFTNGFHDTANAMATSIATRALSPKYAVALAGVLNIAGAFLSVQVAKTVSGGLVEESKITPVVIFGGLVGAILWNLLSWL
jgi:hypothetical protein